MDSDHRRPGIIVTILGVIGTAWKDAIKRIIGRQELDIRSIESSIVPRVEIDNLRSYTSRERDDMRSRLHRLEDLVFAGAGVGGTR